MTGTDAMTAYLLDTVLGSLPLYAISVVYWGLVALALVLRRPLRRRPASDRLLPWILGTGVLALVAAVVDAAVRGPQLVHLSLVAYLATPVGVGRILLARLDGRPVGRLHALALRQVSYVTAFAGFVLLSVVTGDAWWFEPVVIDDSSAVALLEATNWFHVMATAWGLAAAMDLLGSLPAAVRSVRSGRSARAVEAA